MRNKLTIGGIVTTLVVAATVSFGSVTSATQEDEQSTACYEQVPYTVYQYQKTTPGQHYEAETHQEWSYKKSVDDFKTQHEIDKFTRERSRTSARHYSWNGGKRGVNNPPTVVPPHADWQPNTKNEPHGNVTGLHVQGNSETNASWFFFVPYGEWSAWSTPARWPGNTHLAWVDAVPAANWQEHGNSYTDTYQRDWTEFPTGATRQVKTGSHWEYSGWVTEQRTDPWVKVDEKTVVDQEAYTDPDVVVYYNDGNVGPNDLAIDDVRNPGWTTDQTLDRSWVQIRTDEFEKDGKEIPCDEQPEPRIERDTVDGICETPGQETITVNHLIRTSSWAYNYDTNQWVETWGEWVADEPPTSTRALNETEQTACMPEIPEPSVERRDVGVPECGDTTIEVEVTTVTWGWEYNSENQEWVGTAASSIQTETRVLAEDELVTGDECVEDSIAFKVIGTVCEANAPYLQWEITPTGFTPTTPVTLTIQDKNGVVVQTITDAGLTGQVIYPGAGINPSDWPGWKRVNGVWVEDPTDAHLRDGLIVTASINPSVTAAVSYPPQTSACASPTNPPNVPPAQTTTTVPSTSTLADTGSTVTGLLLIAGLLVAAGSALVIVRRKRGVINS